MSRLRAVALVLGVAVCGLAPAASAPASIPAPPSAWYGLPGLDAGAGASWVRAYAYSSPPNVVYAGLEGGGVYKSVNGGATWAPFNGGFANPLTVNVRALLSSSTGTTVYAGTDSGLYTSTGGGAWKPLPLAASVQALYATDSGTAMLAGVFSGGVYRSNDAGQSWTPPAAGNGMPASETVYSVTSNIPGVIYATGASGVYRSTDIGVSWTRTSDGIPNSASPLTTWGYPQRPDILFTSTLSDGVYRSINGGVTWAAINDGLGAVRARGFQIFPGADGAHLYAATEDGLWEALSLNAVAPARPHWRQVTQAGLGGNTIMWALTAPAIPGAGSLGLLAGTQSNGGYFISFEPPDSPCSVSNPNTSTDCPRVVGTVQVASTLTATKGAWTGTALIDYAYQWQSCTTASASSCADIPDAQETTYTLPPSATGLRYRVTITASNPAPSFGTYVRHSTLTAPATANASAYPGSNQTSAPSISVLAPGEQTTPTIGDQLYAEYGTTPNVNSDGWFNPKATTSIAYQWLRCDGSGTDCNELPGATARTYTLQTADGTHDLRVRVTGTNPSGKLALTSGASYDVISAPAAIAAPLPPDVPGGAAKSQAPALTGDAYPGETLAGSVGGWQDPTTDFLRRWVRCDAAGNACTPIQKVNSTDPETGSTYVVRTGDLGATLRLRVTADVNNDLTVDGTDNHVPAAVEVDTPPSAVVTTRPVVLPPPPGGGGGGGGGGGAAPAGPGIGPIVLKDTRAPVLSGLRLSKRSFVAGKGTAFRFTSSEAGTVRIAITLPTRGRKVGKSCKPKTPKNRKKKVCTYQQAIRTIGGVAKAGAVSIAFDGKAHSRKLKTGSYRATVTVSDAAGNVSKPAAVTFKIVRR